MKTVKDVSSKTILSNTSSQIRIKKEKALSGDLITIDLSNKGSEKSFSAK